MSPEPLSVGVAYTKKHLSELFDAPDLARVREGWYARNGNKYVPFFVTLDKASADPGLAYNDYFEGDSFFWESQNKSTLESPWIRKILVGEVQPLLFVREVAKVKSNTQPFFYVGRLTNPTADLKSSRPVKFVFDAAELPSEPAGALKKLLAWKPFGRHAEVPSPELTQEVEKKRRARAYSGQGREDDPNVRRAIELHAMRRAARFYTRKGYIVTDTSAHNPYDLLCEKEGFRARRVEVKGTRGAPDSVTVTIGEVLSAREGGVITDLFIVHGISIKKFNGEPVAEAGKLMLVQDWAPDDGDLRPLTFSYLLPKSSVS